MAKAKKTVASKSPSAKSKPAPAKPAAKEKAKAKEKVAVKAKAPAEPIKVVAKEPKTKAKEVVESAVKPSALAAKPEKAKKVAVEKPPKVAKVVEPKVKKPTKAALALTEETKRWSDINAKHGSEKAKTYQMSDVYESGTPIQHKILGWGWIVNVENDRLEVLFEQGKKFLISNYKPK